MQILAEAYQQVLRVPPVGDLGPDAREKGGGIEETTPPSTSLSPLKVSYEPREIKVR